jgi:hypothetical protein
MYSWYHYATEFKSFVCGVIFSSKGTVYQLIAKQNPAGIQRGVKDREWEKDYCQPWKQL